MAAKLPKNTFPAGNGPDDFQCFGPPALKDGEFADCKIADLGCFTQDGKDSNKRYHAAVVKSRKDGSWYAYFEWGRTGASKPSFQFIACDSEAEAQYEFASQLHSKNDRRGEWVVVAGLRTLRARAGQDCYLVRPMATRCTGLPDARSIKANEGARAPDPKNGAAAGKKANNGKAKKGKKAAPKVDEPTWALLRDLAVATVAFTRGSMADASLPTQAAIDEARTILAEAQKRLAKVGDDVQDQVKDAALLQLTALMYGRIPRKKALRAAPAEWILNQDNILAWQNDLDAFESALYATDIDHGAEVDPLAELQLTMAWVPPDSALGRFLYEWWPQATANRHAYVGPMKIKNLWQVERHADQDQLPGVQKEILASKPAIEERPLFQPAERADAKAAEAKRFHASNTALLFHGTRSVNVRGILREALRLPKQLVGVVLTGAMFGPGLYFADDWKKSAGYTSLTHSYWGGGSGAISGRGAFMFAADVVLGKAHVAPQAHGYTAPPDGHHSIFGKAGHSGVQNNEFIVFDPRQHRLRYLIEFTATQG
jgi:hypothetical protein